MAQTWQDITDAEMAILQVLWDRGALPIRRITDALYPEGKASQYGTVQKLLERLENKAYVFRDRSENVHVFSATVDRDKLVGRRLQALAEDLCGGSLTPLLTHLVQNQKLTAKERASLRELIERHDSEDKKGRRA